MAINSVLLGSRYDVQAVAVLVCLGLLNREQTNKLAQVLNFNSKDLQPLVEEFMMPAGASSMPIEGANTEERIERVR